MKQQNYQAHEAYQYLQWQGLNVEFICGKWLLNKKEYPLYGRKGLLNQLGRVFPWIEIERNRNQFIRYIIDTQADDEGEWPEIEMVSKAKSLLAQGYEIQPLAYPLNEKELKILHYLLDGDPKDTYAIFFHGVGGSGKSTICNLFASIFGDQDVSRCGFNQLGEKFARETLAGKRLWYDADISPNWNESASNTLKKVITHDKDQFEQKGKNPYTAQFRCKALFCCNVAPKFDVSDSGLLRRLVYYSKNDKIICPDGNLVNKKYTEEELINIVCAALKTDISNFYEEFKSETRQIIMSSNSVAKYGMADSYDLYVITAREAGYHTFGKEKWEMLRELFLLWRQEEVLNGNTEKYQF